MNQIQNKIRSVSARLNFPPIGLILIATGAVMNIAIFAKMPLLFIISLMAGGYLIYSMRKG